MSRFLAIMLLLVQMAYTIPLNERGSNSFAGSNTYYLHGLLPQEQADYIKAIQTDGGKVVRLWGELAPWTCFINLWRLVERKVVELYSPSHWYNINLHQIIQHYNSS
jgi:hypothetical protein